MIARAAFLTVLAVALAVHPAGAEDPSVLVQTAPPRQGALPDLVTAYGTAVPAFGGGLTLSLPQDGRVLSITVTPGEQVKVGEPLIEFGASATTSSAYQQATTALSLSTTDGLHRVELDSGDSVTARSVAVGEFSRTVSERKRCSWTRLSGPPWAR